MRSRFLPQMVVSGALVFFATSARAEDPVVPGDGFDAPRYEALWTKSPFAVATADAASQSSDYALVGIAQFDGVSYASVVDKQSQEHFLVSSDKPVKGLTLVSVTRGNDPSGTLAVLQKEGQSITLKLELTALTPASSANGAQGQPNAAGITPGTLTPQIPMPGSGQSGNSGQLPPSVRIRPRIIRVPPPPAPPQQFQPQAQPQQPPPPTQ